MGNVRWKVFDPLGNEICLSEENLKYHITGTHDDKDARTRERIEEQVKYSLQNPRFIFKDKDSETRRVYIDFVDILNDDIISIRPLFIVVENTNEIVTWFAKRTVKINVKEDGGILYDGRLHNLQIRQKV